MAGNSFYVRNVRHDDLNKEISCPLTEVPFELVGNNIVNLLCFN